jgi:hypothetical protein
MAVQDVWLAVGAQQKLQSRLAEEIKPYLQRNKTIAK